MGVSYLDSLSLSCLAVDLCICSNLLLKEASLMMTEQSIDFKSLGYQVSGSWSPKNYWVWVPSCGMCLKSNLG